MQFLKQLFSTHFSCVAVFFLLSANAPLFAQTRYYVKPAGNDAAAGTSWNTAKQSLQAALTLAVNGDQIWVQAGVYKPQTVTSPFILRSGVKLYGGFAGNETTVAARDTSLFYTINATILSGDLQNDDIAGVFDANNAAIILKLSNVSNRTRIDGFIIERAAQSAVSHTGNNGLSKATFQNCLIRNSVFGVSNTANNGISHPRFVFCRIYNNQIGIKSLPTNLGSCNPQIDSSYLYNNSEGAIFSESVAGTDNALFIKKTVFTNNSNATNGGAIQQIVAGSGNVNINDCIFKSNYANNGNGGAVYIFRKNTTAICGLTLQNSVFSQNSATQIGGAIAANTAVTQVWLRNSFKENTAQNGGAIGLLAANAATTQIVSNNNVLSGNSATQNGGAIFAQTNNLLNFLGQNNLFTGNYASANGGVLAMNGVNSVFKNSVFAGNKAADNAVFYTGNALNLQFYNCIIWKNSGISQSDATMQNCVVEGGWNGTGSNNLSDNPMFIDGIDFVQAPTTAGDFHTKICSPTTNTGNNIFAASQSDLDNKIRILGSIVDIGAYEQNANFRLSVASNANQNLVANAECGDNSDWTHFYNTTTNTILFSIKRNGNDATDPAHNIGNHGSATPCVAELRTTANFGSGNALNLSNAPYVSSTNGWYAGNFYWKLTPFNEPDAAKPVSVRLYYSAALLNDLTGSVPSVQQDIKKCTVFKVDNPYNPLDNAVSSAAFHQYKYSETENNTLEFTIGNFQNLPYVEFQTSSFSGGGIGAGGGNNGALPVRLVDFQVKVTLDNQVLLDWQTASETNSNYFAIERSENGSFFETIGKVKSQNAPQGSRYFYIDSPLKSRGSNATTSVFYYRLRPTDFDGSFTYSLLRSAFLTESASRNSFVFPNPAIDILNIKTSDKNRKMQIVDLLGRVKITENTVPQSIDISSLDTGVYFLQIGEEEAVKFFKN